MSIIIHNTEFDPKINKYYLDELIENYIREDKISDLFIILPTAKWKRRLNNSIIMKYFEFHNKPVTTLNIFNLKKFIEFVFSKLFNANEYIVVSDAYRLALFEEACNSADIKFFRNGNQTMNLNLIKRLSQTIYGLKEDGISLADLEKDLFNKYEDNDNINDRNRLSDIYNIYYEFEEKLGKRLLDLPSMINKVASELLAINSYNPQKIKEKVFDNRDILILVNGFTDFKKPEIELFSKFGYSDIRFVINMDFSIKNGPLCGNMIEIIKWFEETKKFKIFDDDIINNNINFDNYNDLDINTFLRRNLFYGKNTLNYDKLNSIVHICELQDKHIEIKFIAKLIKKLILEDKYQSNEICVVTRNPAEYTDLIRNEFNIEKIPYNISDRFELKSSPIITLIFNVLELVLEDYHRDKFINILRNPILNINNEDSLDINNLIRVFSTFKLLRFPWEPKFENRIYYLEKLIEQKSKDGADDFEIFKLEDEKKSVVKALEDYIKIKKIFPEVNRARNFSPSDFHKFIKKDIIEKLGIVERIKEFYKQINIENTQSLLYYTYEEIEKLSKALNKFIALLDEMVFILNIDNSNTNYKLDILIEKLKIAVSGEKYNIKEKINYGIEVTSIEQIRGIPYKVSILCGCFEGNFPIGFKTDSFIGKELPNSKERHYNSEQVQFYQFLTNNIEDKKKQIYITYPKTINDNEIVPSHFLNALYKITNLEVNPANIINDETARLLDWYNYLTNSIEIEEDTFIKMSKGIIDNDNFYFYNVINKNDLLPKVELKIDDPDIVKMYHIDKNTKISISDLEKYNECPYKYYVYKILKIKENEEISKSLSPLEKGNIIHYILYKFFIQLKNSASTSNLLNKLNNQFITISLQESKKEEIYDLFVNIAHNILNQDEDINPLFEIYYYELLGFEYQPQIIKYPKFDDNNGKLIQWLRNEINRHNEKNWKYYPSLFEFSFGFDKNTPAVSVGDKFMLRGKIDRVEFNSNTNDIKFLIADYKNKILEKHKLSAILKGESYQMPLYMYAFKEIINNKFNIEAGYHGAVYYPTTNFYFEGKNIDKNVALYDDELKEYLVSSSAGIRLKNINIEDIIKTTIDNSISIANEINRAVFDIRPGSHCKNCSFASICRKDEI